MAEILNTIGLISGGLGIIGFLQSNIPGDPPPEGASIRIKAGNPGDDDPGVAGGVSAAYSWDINNNYQGKSDGVDVDEPGDIGDVTIDSFSGGSRADFVGISVGDDALCVAWVSVSQHDDTTGGAWTGDVGYNCDQHWYENTEPAGWMDEEQTEEYVPKCTWLDGDHTGDTPSAAMKFRVLAYGEKAQDTVDNNHQCDSTVFGADDAPISGEPSKRSFRPRKKYMENTLVVSNMTQHDAKLMCNSDKSWGPDFVDTKGNYCDMHDHTLHPLCSHKQVDGCIDIDHGTKNVQKRSVGVKRNSHRNFKSFEKITYWGS